LIAWLTDHPDTRLVVIDTLAKIRKKNKNVDGYTDDDATISELKAIADKLRVAILLIHHTRKAPAEDPFDEVSGTLGLNGAADSLLVLDRRRGEALATLYTTGRDLPEASLSLRFDDSTCMWSLLGTADGIDISTRQRDTRKVDECCAWLKQFLAEFAYPSNEIVAAGKKAGFSFDMVKSAKEILKQSGLRNNKESRFQGAWWSGFGPANQWKLRPDGAASFES
jgi:AAA domain